MARWLIGPRSSPLHSCRRTCGAVATPVSWHHHNHRREEPHASPEALLLLFLVFSFPAVGTLPREYPPLPIPPPQIPSPHTHSHTHTHIQTSPLESTDIHDTAGLPISLLHSTLPLSSSCSGGNARGSIFPKWPRGGNSDRVDSTESHHGDKQNI